MEITNPAFEQTITLADAYRIMCKFVAQYNARGETSTVDLMTDIGLGLWADGGSADPAQLSDYLAVAQSVLGEINREQTPITPTYK